MSDNLDRVHYNRIIWHSRRGMLELDLLLEPFVRHRFPELGERERQLYVQLLDCEDQQLFNWFLKKEPVEDPLMAEIVELVLSYSRESAH